MASALGKRRNVQRVASSISRRCSFTGRDVSRHPHDTTRCLRADTSFEVKTFMLVEKMVATAT